MIVTVTTYPDQCTPRWRARAVAGGVRVWVGPYDSETRATSKAIDMVRGALALEEAGDFIVDPETGAVRARDPHEPVNTPRRSA
jgi:hypothetical protein